MVCVCVCVCVCACVCACVCVCMRVGVYVCVFERMSACSLRQLILKTLAMPNLNKKRLLMHSI